MRPSITHMLSIARDVPFFFLGPLPNRLRQVVQSLLLLTQARVAVTTAVVDVHRLWSVVGVGWAGDTSERHRGPLRCDRPTTIPRL